MDLNEHCELIRGELEAIKGHVGSLLQHYDLRSLSLSPLVPDLDDPRQEVTYNLVATYRHFEDARMRMGKVMQALDGGTSVYDQTPEWHVQRALDMIAGRSDEDGKSATTYLEGAFAMLQKPECPSCGKTETCEPCQEIPHKIDEEALAELKRIADKLTTERQAVLDQIAGMVV